MPCFLEWWLDFAHQPKGQGLDACQAAPHRSTLFVPGFLESCSLKKGSLLKLLWV